MSEPLRSSAPVQQAAANASSQSTISGHPQEQLQVAETGTEDESLYPKGVRLWTSVVPLFTVSMLHGLDLTILAAVVPTITNHFKTVEDIGWYSSSYSVTMASFGFMFGRLYTLVSNKRLYMIALGIFELGSLLCTVAPTSWFFILGRCLAGIGAAGIQSGSLIILTQCFPRQQRPIWSSLLGATQMLGIISSPIIGGALIDRISWRGCFGINLPIGAVAGLLIAFGYQDIVVNPDSRLPLKEKLNKFDLLGTVFLVPSVTCLLLALQWGGIRFGWGNPRIIVLLVLFALLLAAFAWRQYRLGEAAILPPRILRMRSVLAGSWYSACVNSTLAVTEYYITIFFQGVKGYTATQSGLLLLPMLVGMVIGGLVGGVGTSRIGYYNPFMIATTVLAPIASGLLTTVELDDQPTKVMCFLGFLGVAVGFGLQSPLVALQTIMKPKDLPLGIACTAFGSTMGNAIWMVVSAALFQNRLIAEVSQYSPSTNATLLGSAGLSGIRDTVGSDRLRDVLLGYDEAITQTLYLPVALCVATILGSAFTEWHSVKKKQS
ncbi:uncharacterized protein JN550_011687 [Neoarthrinium moseri]|uniref:uncharacterized protein n=1 Tax=Neoarthrinium moseri TaxID=1658444 RepID=UPI001FDD8C5B|nr:uncharacterized protein JN550_011687 [Neoarthrinium moseri]KAI1860003.1 hypothetical protein JN550_011687 [Neoarthrinium moseri]